MNTPYPIKVLQPSTVDEENRIIWVQPDEKISVELHVPEDETRDIHWIASFRNRDRKFDRKDFLKNKHFPRLEVTAHHVFSGTAAGWIEAVLGTEEPTGALTHGYHIKYKDYTPKVLKVEWRERRKATYEDSTYHNGQLIQNIKMLGQRADLHIYTYGLYGTDIMVKLVDENLLVDDVTLPFRDPGVIAQHFTRQVRSWRDIKDPTKRVQKVVLLINPILIISKLQTKGTGCEQKIS